MPAQAKAFLDLAFLTGDAVAQEGVTQGRHLAIGPVLCQPGEVHETVLPVAAATTLQATLKDRCLALAGRFGYPKISGWRQSLATAFLWRLGLSAHRGRGGWGVISDLGLRQAYKRFADQTTGLPQPRKTRAGAEATLLR